MRTYLYLGTVLGALLLPPLPSAAAQAAPKIPDNTASCADFKKNADGTWIAVKDTAFTFAGAKFMLKAGSEVTDTTYFSDNNRLIDTLNAKCGGR